MVKRDSVKISMNKMTEAMADGNTHDFFTESRKLKGQNINLSKTIDNASNNADIANLFGKIYDELYNSESYNKSDMENLSECIKASINVNDKYTISVHDVTSAVLHLKKGKTDGHEGLCSDNIINDPHSLFVILTLI